MKTLAQTLYTAGVATLATTLTSIAVGRRDTGHGAAPLNATSHIVWGDGAAAHDRFDVKHTVVGAALNAGAMLAWAAVQEALLGRWARRGGVARAAAGGVATAALAYVTDYHVVPRRLTPGFEMRLSGDGMAAMYASLALALAAGLMHGPREA
jgi:hypothetical protein